MQTFRRSSRRSFVSQSIAVAGCAAGGLALPGRSLAAEQPWTIEDPLRLAGGTGGLPSLDPALSRDLSTNFLLRQLYRGLMWLNADLEPVPGLAESVDQSDDRLTFRFVLRETARFHDRRSITAPDVATSLTRALNPAIAEGNQGGLAAAMYLRDIVGAAQVMSGEADHLEGIAIEDERRLTITLSQPSPTFLMKLASVQTAIVDAGQAASADGLANPNGTGPFMLERWEPGEVLELRSADTWWEGEPALRSIQARLGSSASQPFNLFQAGQIDLVPDLSAEVVDFARDPASGVLIGTLAETTVFATSYIALGNTSEPLDDIHVRRALQRVFPANRIAVAMLDGNAVAATGLVPPGMLGEEWRAVVPTVDLDAAREELEQSRYGSADAVPPIPIYAADIGAVEALRDIARESLGLDVEAIQVAWSDYMTGLAAGEFAAYGLYWGADYPDPESMIGMLFESGSSDNYSGYTNVELDALLAEARTVDGSGRVELLRSANQLLIDDAAVIPLYYPRGYTLARPGIGGVEDTPMGILGLETIHAVDA